MKEKLVRMFGFADNDIVTIFLHSPSLVYVITNPDDYCYLYACRIEDNLSSICLKCGSYGEMVTCAEMLTYSCKQETFRYDV